MAVDIRSELEGTPDLDRLLTQVLIEGVPALFGVDSAAYLDWRMQLASRLAVDPSSIRLVGSACLGASLNPNKNFKAFDHASDIDVAIVSTRHFDEAWYFLRTMAKSTRLGLPYPVRTAIQDHASNYVYWGAIATDRILAHLPFGPHWHKALNEMAQIEPTIGRQINARLYRDVESVRSYHLHSFQKARSLVLGGGA